METPDQAAKLMAQRAWLDKVQALVRGKCPPQIGSLVNVVNVEGDSLIISVPNSAIASQMRWLMSKLYDSLCVDVPGFQARFKDVVLRVRDPNAGAGKEIPEPPKEKPERPKPPPSARRINSDKAAEAYTLASLMPDSPIKARLLRFYVENAAD